MKTKEATDENIYYDIWETPLKGSSLYLLSILQDLQFVHFFFLRRFNEGDEDKEEIYELTIPTGDSYKITEENQGWKTNKYFFDGMGPKGEKYQKCRTYKVWNTPYAKDTYCSGLIVAENNPNPEHIFEYLIIGQDEWVEFFTRAQPKWTRLEKGSKIADLVAGYLKIWGPDVD
jgi:hypothetical protein